MIDPLDINDTSIKALIRLGERPDMGFTTEDLKAVQINGDTMRPLAALGWVERTPCNLKGCVASKKTSRWRITELGQAVVRRLVGELRNMVGNLQPKEAA